MPRVDENRDKTHLFLSLLFFVLHRHFRGISLSLYNHHKRSNGGRINRERIVKIIDEGDTPYL